MLCYSSGTDNNSLRCFAVVWCYSWTEREWNKWFVSKASATARRSSAGSCCTRERMSAQSWWGVYRIEQNHICTTTANNNNSNNTCLMALWLGLPESRCQKGKTSLDLLEQEIVIGYTVCKSASRPRQITMSAPHQSCFTGRMPFLLPNQQLQSTEGTYL